MSGLQLAAQYSFQPHQLGLCGPKDKKNKKELESKKVLKKFKTAYAYYKLIACCNNIKDPFDKRVIRAYWIGSELLEKVPIKEFRKLISQKFGLPAKAKLLSKKDLPHHNTHVEIIGAVYSDLKFTPKIKKLCKITCQNNWSCHWGHKCEKLSKRDSENLKKYGD